MAHEATFRPADLLRLAGVGHSGERLISAVEFAHPADLRRAMLLTQNAELTAKLTPEDRAKVAALVAGDSAHDVAHDVSVKVRGGPCDAWITYAFIDGGGRVVKGALPHSALVSASMDGHVSQSTSVMASPAARDHLAAKALASAASAPRQTPVDPVAAMTEASEAELVAQMTAHPERVDAVKAFEHATRGDAARASIVNFNEGGA